MGSVANRLPFPEDRTSFVYQKPGQPILTPPRTGFQVYLDEDATELANIVTPDGDTIPHSTIYTGEDSLMPIFFGPLGLVHVLYIKVVGGESTVYPISAFYSSQIEILPTLLHGQGPPPNEIGVQGSSYIDSVGAGHGPVLYGPKGAISWPSQGTPLRGDAGPPGGYFEFQQMSPSAIWVINHPLTFRPGVTTIDSAGMEMQGDVSYPLPSRVVVEFSAPTGGSALLS